MAQEAGACSDDKARATERLPETPGDARRLPFEHGKANERQRWVDQKEEAPCWVGG